MLFRSLVVGQALRMGMSEEDIHDACKIDPWFIARLKEIVDLEKKVREHGLPQTAGSLRMLKAAMMNKSVEKGHELDDAEALQVVQALD